MTIDRPVLLATTATEFEAHAKAAILADEGIEAQVTALPPAVWVASGALERARRLLEERLAGAAAIDWETADLGARTDDLPLRQPGRRTLLVWVGWGLAVVLILVVVIAALW